MALNDTNLSPCNYWEPKLVSLAFAPVRRIWFHLAASAPRQVWIKLCSSVLQKRKVQKWVVFFNVIFKTGRYMEVAEERSSFFKGTLTWWKDLNSHENLLGWSLIKKKRFSWSKIFNLPRTPRAVWAFGGNVTITNSSLRSRQAFWYRGLHHQSLTSSWRARQAARLSELRYRKNHPWSEANYADICWGGGWKERGGHIWSRLHATATAGLTSFRCLQAALS